MAITAQFLKGIVAEARPIIERQMNDAKLIAGFRTVVANNGGDWGALKALIKAQVEDENDEAGDGKRVQKIIDKADDTAAYADMLGLANMNEKNFSEATQSYAEAKGREFPNPYPEFTPSELEELHRLGTAELTQTQEQPDGPATQQRANVHPQHEAHPSVDDSQATVRNAGVTVGSDERGTAASISPSPETPQVIADDEAAQANPTSSAPIADPHSSQVEDGQPQPSANVPSAGQSGFEPGHNIDEFAQQRAGDPQDGNEPVSGEPASVTFKNPRCQSPDTCSHAHLKTSCHDCFLAWGSRPREEQVRLWAEAEAAAQ